MKRFCATVVLLMTLWCASAIEKSTTIVYINGTKYYIHAVAQGETLYSLAKAYEVSEEQITQHNPAVAAGLQAGFKLKIPVTGVAATTPAVSSKKLKKTFASHFVARGETLYSIAHQYEIPVQTILEDNPEIDPAALSIGQRILVRKKEIGKVTAAEIHEDLTTYAEQLSSVTEGDDYYVVQKGDTFYSLAKRYAITEEELSALNNGLQAADLKAGAMIRIPSQEPQGEQEDQSEEQHATDEADSINRPVMSFRAVCNCDPLRVSLLLPMTANGRQGENYLEFYQGFLLGLDSLKNKKGYSVDLDLYDTKRSPEEVARIVEEDRFRRSQLIVGPVYENELEEVIDFAEQKQIPIISPLAHITRIQSDALFQMAPDPRQKYNKAASLLDGEKSITLIYTESTDRDFENEIIDLLGEREFKKHLYKYLHPSVKIKEGDVHPSDLSPLLDNDMENVFVIMADNEIDVDRVLAALASADTNLRARSMREPKYSVLGNSRWNRYRNIDQTIFFKNRVVFFSTYHAKRDSGAIINFDRAYLKAFGSLPSLYAYRGYDAARIFVEGMYNDIEYDMEDRRYMPLRTAYRFEQRAEDKNHVNTQWMRVSYNTDFTITVE